MANTSTVDPQRNHVRFICSCITVLGLGCILGGVILIFKGYNGDLLIGGALAAISGLCGFLGAGRSNTPQPGINVSGQSPNVAVNQPDPPAP